MKNKGFLLTILGVIVIGAGIYAYLGGFSQAEIKVTTSKKMYLAGKPYQGSVKSPDLGLIFQEAGKLMDNHTVPGDLGNIFYNDPEKHHDSISAFIGIIVKDPSVKLPAGYELRTLPAGKPVLRVNVEAHYMLAPGKMYPALQQYVQEHNLKLQDVFVERYHPNQKATVLAFLEENPAK